MIDKLPDDVIYYILNRININPISFLMLRNINKQYRKIIYSIKGLYYENIDYENIINSICLKKEVPCFDFKWLLENQTYFSLNSIKNLIKEGRYDVIKEGIRYEHFFKVLFNRFYIHTDIADNIFTFTECRDPVIIAGIHNRVNIINLLLENSKYNENIIGLLDISIKYNYKKLFSYLIVYKYNFIKNNIQDRIINILFRIANCEDIFFYLIQTDKIVVTIKILNAFISQGYNDIFKYCYHKKYKEEKQLIIQCIESNNKEILNYLFSEDRFMNQLLDFNELFFRSKKSKTKEFISTIIDNHIHMINFDSPLIKYCLSNSIDDNQIIQLINKGYKYTLEDMGIVLSMKKIQLLEVMCKNYHE
tara:strand:+ start:158 stop:1243 length:1086 start_codon:yes stop_codon:yes gene_type:complete